MIRSSFLEDLIMRKRSVFASILNVSLLGLMAAGCGDDGSPGPAPLVIPAGCNPIAFENDCLLPYPSDFFLTDDASMPSGKRVVLTEAALPRTAADVPFDFTVTHPIDGFSPHQPIMAYFPTGVTTDGVVFHTDDPTKSQWPDSKALLIDAETGKAVPAWAEIDMSTPNPPERAFVVRPFTRLENGKRYIVALQGLFASNEDGTKGEIAKTPAGFMRIRDKQAASDPVLGPIAERYEKEIFPALLALGVSRDKLQLAWDFTVSSEENNTRDLLALQADLIPKLTANAPAVTVKSVVENTPQQNENIWLRIEGTIRVPLYLTNDQIGAKLFRDAAGKIAQNGEAEVPFTLQLPHSANPADANFEPARMLEYGHGFFGLQEEINYGFMRGFTNEQKYAAASVDWWGMAEPDINIVIQNALEKQGEMFDFVDRLHQAMANFIALSYALKGPIAELPALQRFNKPLYDPAKLYYYGISQGAIFGVTMLALNPLIDRAALGVGGGPYSLMMSRSASFSQLYGLLQSKIQSPLAIAKLLMLSQGTWDRVDPMTYAPHLLTNTFPGSPANRHLLLQNGIGDHSVNNLSTHLVARAIGIPLLEGASAPIWGLNTTAGPADDALVMADYKLPTLPGVYYAVPTDAEKNGVHEDVRQNPKLKAQIDAFFQPNGTITNTCDGVCDPE